MVTTKAVRTVTSTTGTVRGCGTVDDDRLLFDRAGHQDGRGSLRMTSSKTTFHGKRWPMLVTLQQRPQDASPPRRTLGRDRRRPYCAGRLIDEARDRAYPGKESVATNETIRALQRVANGH